MIEQTAQSSLAVDARRGARRTADAACRRHRAQVRYWLWLAASLKFLIPFAALTPSAVSSAGASLRAVRRPMTLVVDDAISSRSRSR